MRVVPGNVLVNVDCDERLIAPGDREKAGEKREGELGENRDIPGDIPALELEEAE